MVEAVVVGGEAVVYAPEDGLGAAGDADLAVGGANVGLDRVRAQVGELGDLGVAFSLGDQGQDLALAVAQPFAAPGPVQPGRGLCPGRWIADNPLAGVDGFEGPTRARAGSVLDR